jgi:hypothetical protein
MLQSVKELRGYTIHGIDGDAGKLYESYFDDQEWNVRYLVVDTGNWLTRRRVLVSPRTLGQPDGKSEVLPANLTKRQVENSPPTHSDRVVSRQGQDEGPDNYYLWPYWRLAAPGFGLRPLASAGLTERTSEERSQPREQRDDPHLRSTREVIGYRTEASDGDVGLVEDFLVDDDSWRIPYMVVAMRGLLTRNRFLVAALWIDRVSRNQRKVHVDLPREIVENSPEFDPSTPVSGGYEIRLLEYYGGRRTDSELD